MQNYLELLNKIATHGDPRMDRTGVGTRALFTEMLEWDLSLGFPIVTTKKINFAAVAAELLWFLSGSSDVRDLQKLGCNVWNANAEAPYWVQRPKDAGGPRFVGDLGRVYGVQWRRWRAVSAHNTEMRMDYNAYVQPIDQFKHLIDCLSSPSGRTDRRMIVTAWNPGELNQMALPPCHMFFQCFVRGGTEGPTLDLTMYQRSCDTFLGVPFNISSYALLTHMLAQCTGLFPGTLKIIFGDVHVYENHLPQCLLQMSRTPHALPRLVLNPAVVDIDSFTMDDISLEGYVCDPPIKAEMAV